MSFFQKVLASIGVGAAKVDTILRKEQYFPGELVEGEVHVKGGEVAQQIDCIYLALHATYEKEVDDKKHTSTATVHQVKILEDFMIEANKEKVIPFSFRLPNDTPLTIGKTNVYISTGLDIKNAIDPSDNDYIKVNPNELVQTLMNTVSELGFRLVSAECKAASSIYRNRLPFIQELEYKPLSGPFYGSLDELEIMLLSIEEHTIEMLLQVDRKAKGLSGLFAEALDMDESFVSVTISKNDIPNLKQKMQSIIAKYA
ncbi:sporulation protein [Bacillus sp. B1-b2]|uniref:sporulation protein n=1 Tax=Bacillus sp. B1-b2 TaxID=2653201 RepID=UPI001261420E|nr:sporulation protein [Bacillus sp. B1-b2]KAB7673035.1 sporulation protein [Bacillus sp. B1-b2]